VLLYTGGRQARVMPVEKLSSLSAVPDGGGRLEIEISGGIH